jgi:hypothetical protein
MQRGAQARGRPRRRAARPALAALAAACVLALTSAALAQTQHEDAQPPRYPPGFEPVDVTEEVRERQQQEAEKMERDVDFSTRARYTAPEQRLRARYGSATWNLYEQNH